ncbi:MAG: hypothetical protein RLY14_3128 [Planctomycetota bacterium]|jgi:hypothetical protein
MRWWLIPVVFPFFLPLASDSHGQEATPTVKSPSSDSTEKNKSENSKNELKFLRVLRESKKPVSLQTAIAVYKGDPAKHPSVQIDLVGAVHIGEASYYEELNRRFKTYDAVLYELVADPETRIPETGGESNIANPIGAMQYGMKEVLKLDFQLEGINYRAKNFVHADMTPQEMSDSMRNRGDGVLTLLLRSMGSGMAQQASGKAGGSGEFEMLTAMFSSNRSLAMRRAMAKNFENMEKQMAGLADKDGKSTLITERNAKAFEVLQKQLDSGKKKIAVFYGAGHLPDMHRRLEEDFSAKLQEIQWVDAWNLREL